MAEEFGEDNHEDLDRPPAFFPYEGEEMVSDDPIEVTVDGVYRVEKQGSVHRIVMLADDSGRRLPITIGGYEATAICWPLDGQTPDRPMTHDLIKLIIERMGGIIRRVVIDDIWTSTFYSKIYIEQDGEMLEIDSRPSDAIALALRFNVPIFVTPVVFEQAEN